MIAFPNLEDSVIHPPPQKKNHLLEIKVKPLLPTFLLRQLDARQSQTDRSKNCDRKQCPQKLTKTRENMKGERGRREYRFEDQMKEAAMGGGREVEKNAVGSRNGQRFKKKKIGKRCEENKGNIGLAV